MLTFVCLPPVLNQLLLSRGKERAAQVGLTLVREFARRDKVALQFALLHKMRELGVPRDRRFYRSLVFACCKYDDADWALFALENALVSFFF